eukprot:1600493-Pyramimonas_sp.AAC.1
MAAWGPTGEARLFKTAPTASRGKEAAISLACTRWRARASASSLGSAYVQNTRPPMDATESCKPARRVEGLTSMVVNILTRLCRPAHQALRLDRIA